MMGKKVSSRTPDRKRLNMTAEVRPMTLLVCLLVLFSVSSPAFSASSNGLQVLKISPQDRTAVVRGNDGKMKLVREGEVLDTNTFTVPGAQFAGKEKKHTLTVTEIAEGRVVLEEKQSGESETVIIRLVNGKQKVERIRKTAPGKKQQITTAVSGQREDSAQFTVHGAQEEKASSQKH